MDDALKAKWVAALRSGEYRQTQEVLYSGGGYCCLGVLCKIAGADMDDNYNVVQTDEGEEIEKRTTAYIDPEHYTVEEELGPVLRSYFGISSEVESKLVHLNDKDGASFQQIADWIENHSLNSGQALTSNEPKASGS